jgi:uncharacterized membrane protein
MAHNANETPPRRLRLPAAAAAAVLWSAFLFLLYRMPPNGHEQGTAFQFVGRFHPLMVHIPIALLVLVPVMELAGRRPAWAHLRPAAGWLLSLAAIAALATALDGWLLAWSGGYRGRDVTDHMWAAAWLVTACGAAAAARRAGSPRALYAVLLALAVSIMVRTAHTGGVITHGEGYLTDKMPGRMRAWFGMPPVAPKAAEAAASSQPVRAGPGSAEPSNPAFYPAHIAPLFSRSCVSCHGPKKHKGGLRMDSYEQLMRGGEDGRVVVPGNPKSSDIIRRLRLPPSDDDSMPSDGENPFTQEEIQMLEHWIAAGAKGG